MDRNDGWIASASMSGISDQTMCQNRALSVHLISAKRMFDVSAALILGLLLLPLLAIVSLLVGITSSGPVLHWSRRVGKENRIFWMPKFRSMRLGTPEVASHLLLNRSACLTPIGGLLRQTGLDELPQLFSILMGDLSFVGPRPALFNQYDLIALRSELGIQTLVPGLTGWAQVHGRDELSVEAKVRFDLEYLQRKSFGFDLRIIGMTFVQVLGPTNALKNVKLNKSHG